MTTIHNRLAHLNEMAKAEPARGPLRDEPNRLWAEIHEQINELLEDIA